MGVSHGARRLVFLLSPLLIVAAVSAQSTVAGGATPRAPLTGFRGVQVGMTLEQVKQALRDEPLFLYRGDPDVSIVPSTGQTLIEVEGRGYVDRASLQFEDGRLAVLIVSLNRELVSYYEVYTALTQRHGPVASLDPGEAVWVGGGLRVSLEKPVVLKYVDLPTFEGLQKQGVVPRDYDLMTREAFLGTL